MRLHREWFGHWFTITNVLGMPILPTKLTWKTMRQNHRNRPGRQKGFPGHVEHETVHGDESQNVPIGHSRMAFQAHSDQPARLADSEVWKEK